MGFISSLSDDIAHTGPGPSIDEIKNPITRRAHEIILLALFPNNKKELKKLFTEWKKITKEKSNFQKLKTKKKK